MSKSSIVLHLLTPGGVKIFSDMHEGEQQLVNVVHELLDTSIAIGAESPCGALVISLGDGLRFSAAGKLDEHAAVVALNAARSAGITSNITLAFSVKNNLSCTSVPDEVLEALYAFGPATVFLVGDDRSVVIATTGEAAASSPNA
jgi:hypothetical protein